MHDTTNPRSLKAVAARIKATREALGLRPVDLCAQTGIAKNTYSQWENAKALPRLDHALILRETYGITLDWIYCGDPSGLPQRLMNLAQKLRSAP